MSINGIENLFNSGYVQSTQSSGNTQRANSFAEPQQQQQDRVTFSDEARRKAQEAQQSATTTGKKLQDFITPNWLADLFPPNLTRREGEVGENYTSKEITDEDIEYSQILSKTLLQAIKESKEQLNIDDFTFGKNPEMNTTVKNTMLSYLQNNDRFNDLRKILGLDTL